MIGSRIGLIYWLDKGWLATNADRLFQLNGFETNPKNSEGWAAWNAFLIWGQAHIDFYKIFKSQYKYALIQSEQAELPERTHYQPMNYFGEHLMILYARGQLALDDDNGLLRHFLTNTLPDIRRHAIGFVGRLLERGEQIPEYVLNRFIALWEFYWTISGKTDAKEKPDAWLFGTWFSCGQFSATWALQHLEEFVEYAPIPEPDHEVVEELERIAHIDIVKSARILNQMVRGDKEGWHIAGWGDSAKGILTASLKADGEARNLAKDLIDYLGRRGYSGFGILLDEKA